MKKLIIWQDNTLKKTKYFFIILIFILLSSFVKASERWILDKSLSNIEFEVPVFLAKNVQGNFNTIEGYVELDVEKKINNKAIFIVEFYDLEMNYIKYKDLLLSNIFFDIDQFPKAIIDTKKFTYNDEEEINLMVELTLKEKSEMIPLKINVKRLAKELIQIQSELSFSRTSFNIGMGKWKNTTFLKDKVKIKTNLFLFRE
jgi:polyisoprenoid-binding protein YceI